MQSLCGGTEAITHRRTGLTRMCAKPISTTRGKPPGPSPRNRRQNRRTRKPCCRAWHHAVSPSRALVSCAVKSSIERPLATCIAFFSSALGTSAVPPWPNSSLRSSCGGPGSRASAESIPRRRRARRSDTLRIAGPSPSSATSAIPGIPGTSARPIEISQRAARPCSST